MDYEVRQTDEFEAWLDGLADAIGKEAIATRILRVQRGLFGDSGPVGGNVSELRVHVGPGYRAYYTVRGRTIVFMLCGGDKSTQKKDIKKAKDIAAQLE